MIRFVRLVSVVLALACAAPLAAQDIPWGTPGTAFTTVDSFAGERTNSQNEAGNILVTGIVAGESTPRTLRVNVRNVASCERVFAMSMDRPGRYTVSIEWGYISGGGYICKLTRVP